MTLDQTIRNRLALLAGAALIALLALFAALGHQAPDEAHAATTNVNVGQTNGSGGSADEYNSADITVSEGDSVVFDWFDGVHDATSYAGGDGSPDWTSGFMNSAGTFSQPFATAGTYTYYCTIHADWADAAPGVIDANIAAGEMVGKITVAAAAVDTLTPTNTRTNTPTNTPTETPTETPAEAMATDAPAEATPTATDAPATATETSEPETATPTNTPSDATVTAVPPTGTATDATPTVTATEEPAATSQPTASQPAPTAQPRTVNVEAGSEWFGNSGSQNGSYEITVNAGDTVQWNVVEGVHTVYECGDNWIRANDCAGAAWNSDILQTGDTLTQRFSTAGTFYYLCTLHPLTMRGAVTVEGSASPAATATDTTPTVTATEEPASTSEPTATQPAPTQQQRTVNVEAGSEWFGSAGFQGGSFEITISAGDTVQWNVVEGVHTVYECGANWSKANNCEGAAWNSDIVQAGGIYTQRFAAAGTYSYLCTLHPLTMRGAVTVVGSAPPNAGGPQGPTTGSLGVSSPGPSTGLPNSGSGPLSQESARPDSPFGRAIVIAATVTALLAVALVWKEAAWRIRN